MDNMNHLLFDFLDKHADMYEGKDAINPELYDLYKVKRGLRDKNGNGVVAGLTTISTIEAFDISGDQKVPCDGRLYYRGYDVRELVSGTVREKRFGFEEMHMESFTALIFSEEKPKLLFCSFIKSSTCSTGEIFKEDSSQ